MRRGHEVGPGAEEASVRAIWHLELDWGQGGGEEEGVWVTARLLISETEWVVEALTKSKGTEGGRR